MSVIIQNNLDYEMKRFEKHTKELSECAAVLETSDYKYAKEYVTRFCPKEADEIVKEFNKSFSDVPKNDPLRVETLHFLAKIGITVYS